MASSKQTPHPASSLWRLGFPTCIMGIHTSIAIVFASSVRTISKPPRPMGQIKSLLPPRLSAGRWSSDGTNKSVAPRVRIRWRGRNLRIFSKRNLEMIGLLLIASLANSDVSLSINKSQCWNGRHTSSTYNRSC